MKPDGSLEMDSLTRARAARPRRPELLAPVLAEASLEPVDKMVAEEAVRAGDHLVYECEQE